MEYSQTFPEEALLPVCIGIGIILIAIIIWLITLAVKVNKKANRYKRELDAARGQITAAPTYIRRDNSFDEIQRLKKANEQLMSSNIELTAQLELGGNDVNKDYILENDSLKNQIKTINSNLEYEIGLNDTLSTQLNQVKSEYDRLLVDYENVKNKEPEEKKIVTAEEFVEEVRNILDPNIKKAKTLTELLSMKRPELYALAREIEIKGYNKLTNKELATEIFAKLKVDNLTY